MFYDDFLFFCGGGGRKGGRGHLKSLRLQPGKRAGEKRSNEEGGGGVIINFITNNAKPSNPTSPHIP